MTSYDQTGDVFTDPGWFRDPKKQHHLRYFDGDLWTDHVTHRGPEPCGGCHGDGEFDFDFDGTGSTLPPGPLDGNERADDVIPASELNRRRRRSDRRRVRGRGDS